MIETITAEEFFYTLSAALLIGALSMVFILRKYLFSNHRDLYPVKKQKHEKNKKGTGPQDIVPVEPDQYEHIIDDYPTYNRQVKWTLGQTRFPLRKLNGGSLERQAL